MLEWITKKTVLQFNGSYYEQINRLAVEIPMYCSSIQWRSNVTCRPLIFARTAAL